MNITDVGHMTDDQDADGAGEDKMEAASRRLLEAKKSGALPPGAAADIDPTDPYAVASFYAQAFREDATLLGLKVVEDAARDPSRMPRATEKVARMIEIIRGLVEKGCAYVVGAPGSPGTAVYFDVSRFPEYGRLSGNTLETLRAGAGGRVREDTQSQKRHPADFLLWKCDPAHVMKWDSPWGAGHPGWHIECSAMAREALGDEIDLHSGGEDNIFPHHECEIAQSRCATGRERFARHWLHVRHLMVEGEKMSKSLGNFFTIRDLVAKGFDPAAIRLELIKTHYRSNANFTEQGLIDSARVVERWRRWLERAEASGEGGLRNGDAAQRFADAMHDDLNVAGAIGAISAWINETPEPRRADAALLRAFDGALGVLAPGPVSKGSSGGGEDAAVEALLAERAAARKNKDFAESDRIRDELLAMGVEIKDSPTGTTWTRRPRL